MASSLAPPNFADAAASMLDLPSTENYHTSALPNNPGGINATPAINPNIQAPASNCANHYGSHQPIPPQQQYYNHHQNYPRHHGPPFKAENNNNSSMFNSKLLFIIIGLIIIAILVWAGYKWYQNRQIQVQVNNQSSQELQNQDSGLKDYGPAPWESRRSSSKRESVRDTRDNTRDVVIDMPESSSHSRSRFAGSTESDPRQSDQNMEEKVEQHPKFQQMLQNEKEHQIRIYQLEVSVKAEHDKYEKVNRRLQVLKEKVVALSQNNAQRLQAHVISLNSNVYNRPPSTAQVEEIVESDDGNNDNNGSNLNTSDEPALPMLDDESSRDD